MINSKGILEAYASGILLVALVVNSVYGEQLHLRLQVFLFLWQIIVVIICLCLLYLGGVVFLYFLSSGDLQLVRPIENAGKQSSEWIFVNTNQGLSWFLHLLVAILLLLELFRGIVIPGVNTILLGILGWVGIVALASFISGIYEESRRAPAAASDFVLKSRSGMIDISWTLPNDVYRAECLLVRTISPLVPTYPDQGIILCRGELSSWKDTHVEPGTPYNYTLFSYDGNERYSKTITRTESALPLPSPPSNLTYIPEKIAIQLYWTLIGIRDIREVRITRYELTTSGRIHPYSPSPILAHQTYWRDGGLQSGKRYDYEIYSLNMTGQASRPVSILTATLVDPINGFVIRVEKRNQVVLTWIPPEDKDDLQGVFITRTKEPDLDNPPIGPIFGESQYIDGGLEYNSTYRYKIVAKYTDPIESEPNEQCVTTDPQPSAVQKIAAVEECTKIMLHWQLPSEETVRKVLLVRVYSLKSDVMIKKWDLGVAEEYIDQDVIPDTSYTYKISYQTTDGHWSCDGEIDTKTRPLPQRAKEFKARFAEKEKRVELVWVLPDDETVIGSCLVKKQGKQSKTVSDGEEILRGTETSFSDQSVENDKEYYYALFTYNHQGNYSKPDYCKIGTYPRLKVMIYYPDLGDKREGSLLPQDQPMLKIIRALLKRQPIDINSIIDLKLFVEETNRQIALEETLHQVGVESGQTIRVELTTQEQKHKENIPPHVDDQERAPANDDDGEK